MKNLEKGKNIFPAAISQAREPHPFTVFILLLSTGVVFAGHGGVKMACSGSCTAEETLSKVSKITSESIEQKISSKIICQTQFLILSLSDQIIKVLYIRTVLE